MPESEFSLVDYGVFACFLAISVAVGIYHAVKSSKSKKPSRSTNVSENGASRGEKTQDFLTGGRKLPLLPVCLSLLTTFLSGISLLGTPAEVYQRGLLFFVLYWSATFAFILSGYVFVPIFYDLKTTSIYEYLELRFQSKLLRQIGAFLFLVNTLFYMAVVMYAPAVALSGVTHLPTWPFVLAVGLSSTLYTGIGGIKAVIWTDTLQAFFMYMGIAIFLYKGTEAAGGLSEVFRISWESGRVSQLLQTNPSPLQYNSLWISLFGGSVFWLTLYGLNQMALQRYCSMSSLKQARIVIGMTVPAFLILGSMCCFIGMVMLAYFYKCDPLVTKQITTPDQLVILFAARVLGVLPGLPGLFLACLFSGTLSTISSGINSMTAVLWEDFIKEHLHHRLSDSKSANINKVFAFCFGITATMLAFLCQYMGGLVNAAVSTMGAISGPLVGLFVLGVFFPRANKNGAFLSIVIAEAVMIFCSLGMNLTKPYKAFNLPTDTVCNTACDYNGTFCYNTYNNYNNNNYNNIAQTPHDENFGSTSVFPLYRVSPFAYALIGILIVLIIGYPLSLLIKVEQSRDQQRMAYGLTFAGRNTANVQHKERNGTENEKEIMMREM